jgi:putative ABC transport system ATP-binding protein
VSTELVATEIVAADVHVDYDGHEVLAGVDLRAAPGRMVAVTGPSGAGKTTLLWVLAGLVTPARGRVEVAGVPVHDRDQTSAAGVVLVPQDNALASVLTATENVLVPLLAVGVNPEEARERTEAALEAVGLGGAGNQLIEELSGGQQQRVAVARGLAQRGGAVLADEPTSELDAVNRARVVLLLRAEADRGAAVVLATHDPEAAAECDAELHLDAGVATWVRPLEGARVAGRA